MHVNKVDLVLGFGKSPFPEVYKKGEGRDLKEALQSMIAKKYNYITDQEKLAIIEFIEAIQNMDLTFISPPKITPLKRLDREIPDNAQLMPKKAQRTPKNGILGSGLHPLDKAKPTKKKKK